MYEDEMTALGELHQLEEKGEQFPSFPSPEVPDTYIQAELALCHEQFPGHIEQLRIRMQRGLINGGHYGSRIALCRCWYGWLDDGALERDRAANEADGIFHRIDALFPQWWLLSIVLTPIETLIIPVKPNDTPRPDARPESGPAQLWRLEQEIEYFLAQKAQLAAAGQKGDTVHA